MIGSLKGTLISKSASDVLLDVSGVGYQVNVPINTLSELPSPGNNAFLYIYTHVREDAIQLFGFLTQEEKRIFTTLLSISGIGPRVALNKPC
jgi:Holliday junction DNA helicase RuvA